MFVYIEQNNKFKRINVLFCEIYYKKSIKMHLKYCISLSFVYI